MAKKKTGGLWWLLLLLAGAYVASRQTVRFLDPETGAELEFGSAEAAIGRYAAGRGMTAEQFLERARLEAAAEGVPLWQYLQATVPGMPPL